MVLSAKIEVREHTHYGFPCKGLFASEKINKGEIVWRYNTTSELLRIFTSEEILNADKLPISGSFAVQDELSSKGGKGGQSKEMVADEESRNDESRQETSTWQLTPTAIKERLIMYSYMLDDDQYGSTPFPEEDDSYFFNHSCDPNCWYDGDLYIVARRDIPQGSQVCYDYAMTETEASMHEGLHCLCGAACCRKVLDFQNYRSQAWMKEFGQGCTEFIKRKASELGWYNALLRLRFQSPGIESVFDRLRKNLERELKIGELPPTEESPEGPASEEGSNDKKTKQMGLFAGTDIKKGTVLIVFAGKIVDRESLEHVSGNELQLAPQISEDLWQIPLSRHKNYQRDGKVAERKETGDYITHSSNSNCEMRDSVTVVAMRDISEDEEVTIDYARVNNRQSPPCF